MEHRRKLGKLKRTNKGMELNFWDCSLCTFRNTAEAFKCLMCDVRKGTSKNNNFNFEIVEKNSNKK